jgi:hypothetical protein
MTLIITALSDDVIVQVSDRRLTWSNGLVADDLAIKAICVACIDASFSIAFTGLAQVGAQRTDEWLVDYLASINAGCLTFPTLLKSVHEYVAASFLKLRHLGINRRITFAFAGFGPVGFFMGFLSNIEDSKGNRLSKIDDSFQEGLFFRNNKSMHRLDLMINGAEETSRTFDTAIPTFRKRYFNKPPNRIEAALVQFIRRASTDQEYGYLVGRNCLGTVIYPNGEFQCQDYPEKESPQQYMPHLVLGSMVSKNVQIWVGDGAPPWWTGNH